MPAKVGSPKIQNEKIEILYDFMRHLLHFLAVLSLFLLSCSSIDNRFYEIESIMDENPDSALFILERIDIGSLQGDENHALYSLLLTQARDKNYFFEKMIQ